ncbi:Aste57867_20094 [Aphanomyces stellatus]|uniref:Aste57867_20094 protein n=1 Tax=Aphanomyces stellatus TaxID=120398 RepID=A0A485LE67_9STRA|nr:hypothetical protein As57867_020028 [Aphanomyces stellatus]VFT96789.1 Aste57867_20094 [Aphanomyces stellatus]
MDKYRRGEKKTDFDEKNASPNEIRITQTGKPRGYVTYATKLLVPTGDVNPAGDIVLKAMGNAISKAVAVAETLKHEIPNLHTVTNISSIDTVDVYEPLEEGLDVVETQRRIPSISIQLALNVSAVDLKAPGYQKPIPADQVAKRATQEHNDDAKREPRAGGRGRGNGGRGGGRTSGRGPPREESAADDEHTNGETVEGEKTVKKNRKNRPKKEHTDAAETTEGAADGSANTQVDGEIIRPLRKGKGGRGNGTHNQGEEIGDDSATVAPRRTRGRGGGRGRGPKPEGDESEDRVRTASESVADQGTSTKPAGARARTSSAPVEGGRGRGRGRGGRGRGGRGEGKLFEATETTESS